MAAAVLGRNVAPVLACYRVLVAVLLRTSGDVYREAPGGSLGESRLWGCHDLEDARVFGLWLRWCSAPKAAAASRTGAVASVDVRRHCRWTKPWALDRVP
jgi:hypothetical protein